MASNMESFCEILIAILLPPPGVCLKRGCCTLEFLICFVLTILGYIPGIIYAIRDRVSEPFFVQAFDAGVKLIGATSHFVTEELDARPIIKQMVTLSANYLISTFYKMIVKHKRTCRLWSYTRVSGKMKIMGIVKKHVTVKMNCTMDVTVNIPRRQAIQDVECNCKNNIDL
ncbi:unnamed protein product [Brassica oleracea]|uniref:Uncharacterized protein n=2 Tax=Brassica oleracea TaxID=3712 RepID=A0A0D3D9R7_BRAOL|nr:unnamed protein product [Brassica oleracea]